MTDLPAREDVWDWMKERDQWRLWSRDSDPPKKPLDEQATGRGWNDPACWLSFDEAYQLAEEDPRFDGIGFVVSSADPYYGIDVDGGLREPNAEKPKDWVPSIERFAGETAMQFSTSGTGFHIFGRGDIPEWWSDSAFDDAEHEGIEAYDEKFFIITGRQLSVSGNEPGEVSPSEFLYEAYREIRGEYPREETEEAAGRSSSDGDWSQEQIESALNALSSDCSYPMWRNIGFAVHDWDDGRTGKSLFEQWSRGSGWDSDSQRHVDNIWSGADQGDGITVGTLIHHAQEAGWSPSGSSRPKAKLADEVDSPDSSEPAASEEAKPADRPDSADDTHASEPSDGVEADGGVSAATGSESNLSVDESPDDRAGRRLHERVLTPLDPPEEWEGEEIDKRTAAHRTAEIYLEEYNWLRPRSDTRSWRATLYNYVPEEGIYEPHGRAELERRIDKHLGPVSDNQFVNEVAGKIERQSRVRAKSLDEPPERIVVQNGILDLTTGELDEHTPGEFHRTMLDVEYDPDADCEAIDGFMNDVVREKDVGKLYRFIAHALYRGYPEEKAAMLLGEGENGKTTFLNLVEEFLGEYNVAHESLKKVNEHEWAPARLNGKLANIDADMSDQSPDSMGMFKRLTGGDPIHAEVKFEEPMKFTNHATMMFACNEMPVLADDTRGNWRRWQLIKFPYVFSDDDPDAKAEVPKEELYDRLFTDEEFSGLLARCVQEISEWDDGRAFFPSADSWETTRSKMRRAAEPVYDFAHTCLRPSDDEDAHIPKDTLRQAYQRYATQNGLTKLGPEQFGKRLLGLQDFSIEDGRTRKEGGRITVYKGVEFTGRGREILNGNADPDDERQSGLEEAAGKQARVDRVKEVLRDHGSSEMQKTEVYGQLGERFDIAPEDAKTAVTDAAEQGVIIDAGGGLIRPNW